MSEATFWFSSPFREWIGQRRVTVRWEGQITLREVLERLGAEHPTFRAHVTHRGLHQDAFNDLAAVMLDGDFLALDARIPDGAKIDVFTPLAGGMATSGSTSPFLATPATPPLP
jgi:molybdopterin converting factor small subunit